MLDPHDVHTLTGAYATDALPEPERRLFKEHLDECTSCRQEVDGLIAAAARLGDTVAIPVPPDLRTRVLAEITNVRQAPPVVAAADPMGQQAWFRQPLGIAASLLLLLAMGLAAVAATESQRADRAEQTAQRVAALATDPHGARVTRPVRSGGNSTVITADSEAVFRAVGLDPLPQDRAYQLWVMDNSGARSVGLLGRAASGDVQRFVDHLQPGDRIGLTIEPAGGSDRPTSRAVVVVPTGRTTENGPTGAGPTEA